MAKVEVMKYSEINTEQRHLSKVIWFGTKTGGEFGFIDFKKVESNGIFFHKNYILETSLSKLNKFTEDALVSFSVRESKKELGKLEAYNVALLEDEHNIYFLLTLFFNFIYLDSTKTEIIYKIYERILVLIIQPEFKTGNDYADFIEANLGSLYILDENSLTLAILLVIKICGFEDSDIFGRITEAYISLKMSSIGNSSIESIINQFSHYFEDRSSAYRMTIKYLGNKNKDNLIHYLLWIEQLVEEIPVKYIVENIFLLNDKHEQGFLNNVEESYYPIILNDLLHKFESKTLSFESYEESRLFYQLIYRLNLQKYIPTFSAFTPPLIKIDLLLDEVIDYLDLNDYITFITIIDKTKQQLFLKRIFHLVHVGSYSLSLEQISQVKLDDYSSKVTIQLLNKLNNMEKITKYSLKGDVLRLIADLVTDSKDLLSLDGYFDLCTGRTKESTKYVFIPETKERILKYHYEKVDVQFISEKSKEPIICEGRLSKSKDNRVNLSEGGKPFWWCKNSRCFDACRVTKEASDWRNYSLIDFLNILQIDHDTYDVELLYATINKVNSYLERLNCRDCKRILKPLQDSRFGFDRVNTFYCDNSECRNEDKVYLTHCSNGRCEDVIDSRDVAQCPNNWYICDNCFACCATKTMYNRNQNLEINKQELNQIPRTHRGKSIFCPKCGDGFEYKDPSQQAQEYKTTLEDFEKLANISVPLGEQRLIGKNGSNKYGNKWFVIYQSHYSREQFLNYLYYWQSIGFHIIDFPENLNKANYLVTEPIKKSDAIANFNCQNCKHTYEMNSDWNRLNAVKYWHFPKSTD